MEYSITRRFIHLSPFPSGCFSPDPLVVFHQISWKSALPTVLELGRAYYKIRESRVRKRIFEMVKAVGAASHAELLGGRKRTKPGELPASGSLIVATMQLVSP
jgi:hypothetical protein